MENEFNFVSGAWPEKYFFTDRDGVVLWKYRSAIDGFDDIN